MPTDIITDGDHPFRAARSSHGAWPGADAGLELTRAGCGPALAAIRRLDGLQATPSC